MWLATRIQSMASALGRIVLTTPKSFNASHEIDGVVQCGWYHFSPVIRNKARPISLLCCSASGIVSSRLTIACPSLWFELAIGPFSRAAVPPGTPERATRMRALSSGSAGAQAVGKPPLRRKSSNASTSPGSACSAWTHTTRWKSVSFVPPS